MTASQIIERLRERGVEVLLLGDRLKLRAPAEPPKEVQSLIEALRKRKAEALAALTAWDEAEARRLMYGLPVRIHAAHSGRHIPHSPESGAALNVLNRLREERRDMAAFRAALERYTALRVAQAADPELGPAPAGWREPRAGELLASINVRLLALVGDAPIPERDLVIDAAEQRLDAALTRKDWRAFEEAVQDFEKVWRERIARH